MDESAQSSISGSTSIAANPLNTLLHPEHAFKDKFKIKGGRTLTSLRLWKLGVKSQKQQMPAKFIAHCRETGALLTVKSSRIRPVLKPPRKDIIRTQSTGSVKNLSFLEKDDCCSICPTESKKETPDVNIGENNDGQVKKDVPQHTKDDVEDDVTGQIADIEKEQNENFDRFTVLTKASRRLPKPCESWRPRKSPSEKKDKEFLPPKFLNQRHLNDLLVGSIVALPPYEVKNRNVVTSWDHRSRYMHPVVILGYDPGDRKTVYFAIVSCRVSMLCTLTNGS